MTTYLDGVNGAIIESGVELDELTSGNFASTTDPMAKRFKRWYNQSLKEIILERNEWEFQNKKAQVVIYPRLHVIDGNRSTAPPADSTFEGDDSGSTFTVVSTSLLTGTWAGGDAEAYINFLNLSGPVSWNELFDETAPTAANLNVFRAKWFGRYDFASDISGLLEINESSFYIQQASGLADTTLNTGDTEGRRLQFLPWDLFTDNMERSTSLGEPFIVTQTPNGQYDFYPRPNKAFILTFDYTANPQQLSAYDDVISELPSNYHDMVMWRTVMYYADYDNKPGAKARAEQRYEFYKNRAERNLMPVPSFTWNRYGSNTR